MKRTTSVIILFCVIASINAQDNNMTLVEKNSYNEKVSSILLYNVYENKKSLSDMIDKDAFALRVNVLSSSVSAGVYKHQLDTGRLGTLMRSINIWDKCPVVFVNSEPTGATVEISGPLDTIGAFVNAVRNANSKIITTSIYQPTNEGGYNFCFSKEGYNGKTIYRKLKKGETITINEVLSKK